MHTPTTPVLLLLLTSSPTTTMTTYAAFVTLEDPVTIDEAPTATVVSTFPVTTSTTTIGDAETKQPISSSLSILGPLPLAALSATASGGLPAASTTMITTTTLLTATSGGPLRSVSLKSLPYGLPSQASLGNTGVGAPEPSRTLIMNQPPTS